MYISLNIIKKYVDLQGIDEKQLIDKFTLSCAEVEGIIYKGDNISNVVVGKILQVNDHPNSKKLHLLKVDIGTQTLDIVCGAPNVRVGLVVPVAVIGAKVGQLEIQSAVVGGYQSNGMCCGGSELDISADTSGLFELPSDTPIGVDFKKYFEVDDILFEVDNKSITNRPDLWGHYGIAREIAALTGRKLQPLELHQNFDCTNTLDIDVQTDKCYRYTAATLNNVTKKHSNVDMQIKLHYLGMRPINLLTDVTNYVMLELGQPMHAFDNDIVKSVQVKQVDKDTNITTLDQKERVVKDGELVICTNNTPVAIAGVMGGLDSEITDKTTNVLIESACFDSVSVRKTSARLGLRSEASARYEKSLDPNLTMTALKRLVHLIKLQDQNATVSSAITDIYNYKFPTKTIEITKQFIDRFVGVQIEKTTILSILKSLEFDVKEDGDTLIVTVPTFRATKDIQGKQDLVEEITRIYGYANIQEKSCEQIICPTKLSREISLDYDFKYALASRYNMNEVHSYIWEDNDMNAQLNIDSISFVKLVNSIVKNSDNIRSTMIPTLIKSVVVNKNELNNISLFEIGRVVVGMKDNLVDEQKMLGIIDYTKNQSQEQCLLDVKNRVEYLLNFEAKIDYSIQKAQTTLNYINPINYYHIVSNGEIIGQIGLISPYVKNNIDSNCTMVFAELNMTKIYALQENQTKFEQISKYPVTTLDFNFVISNKVLYQDIEKIANSINTNLNYHISLIDIYENENDKSYTLRYFVSSLDHTLTKQEIDDFYNNVVAKFESNNIYRKQ